MTAPQPPPASQALLDQYCLSFRPIIDLLTSLLDCAAAQEAAALSGDLAALEQAGALRSDILHRLAALDASLRPARETIALRADALRQHPGFAELTTLHGDARALVAGLAERDARIQEALQRASERARHSAQQLEVGGTTLAAYRRIVAPPPDSAELVDRRG